MLLEYQKNALFAVLRRFSSCAGMKPFTSYQLNFKRIIVAPEDKKEAIQYTVKNRGKSDGKTCQKQGKKRPKTCKRCPIQTIDKAIGIKYRATK